MAAHAEGEAKPPERILFVGDSLTYANDLDQLVSALAKGSGHPLATDRSVKGGAPLKLLWKKTDARQRLSSGKYDVLLLQEDLPETSVEIFQDYVRRFHAHAAAAGTETVLLMTWPYKRLGWIWTEGIAEAHWKMAAELGVRIVPAALAWERAQAEHPEIKLYDKDEEHPSIQGSFLTAAVVFATLWNKAPVPGATAKALRKCAPSLCRVAWDTVAKCRDMQPASKAPSSPSSDRVALVAAVFARLDRDSDGCLSAAEFQPFEEFMGFRGSAEAFAEEFALLCGELRCARSGFSLADFTHLVDSGTKSGLFCTDCAEADLLELLTELGSAAGEYVVGQPSQTAGLDLNRVVIVPGNGSGSIWDANWYGWLATELKRRGVEVGIRDMPDPVVARESVWLPFIVAELAGGEAQLAQTIVVGHSSGAAAAMRLSEKHKVGGVVLVSAYTSDLGDRNERRSGYFARPWQWDKQAANCGFIVQFASTDDPFLPMDEQRAVRDGLVPKVEYVELDVRSHFFDAPFWELLDIVCQKLGVSSED